MKLLLFLSDAIIPLLTFYIVGMGLLNHQNIYDQFIKGAAEGFKTVIGIPADTDRAHGCGRYPARIRFFGLSGRAAFCFYRPDPFPVRVTAACTGKNVFLLGGKRTHDRHLQGVWSGFLSGQGGIFNDERNGKCFLYDVIIFYDSKNKEDPVYACGSTARNRSRHRGIRVACGKILEKKLS